MTSKVSIAVAVVVVGLLGAASLAGAQYCPSPTIVVQDLTVTPGQTVTASGENCAPNSEVTLTVEGQQVSTATAGDDGRWSTSVTIPDLGPGTYQLVSTCEVDSSCTDSTAEAAVEVLERGAGGSSGGGAGQGSDLADTGTDLALPLQISVLLIAIGGILLASTARRSGSTS